MLEKNVRFVSVDEFPFLGANSTRAPVAPKLEFDYTLGFFAFILLCVRTVPYYELGAKDTLIMLSGHSLPRHWSSLPSKCCTMVRQVKLIRSP